MKPQTLMGILLLGFVLAVIYIYASRPSPGERAYLASQEKVLEFLTDPQGASFDAFEESRVWREDSVWVVSSAVTSGTILGGRLRNPYTFKLQYHTSADQWEVVDMEFELLKDLEF